MRHFALLLFALILALFGLNSLVGTESFAPYILRDGLLVSVLAMLLFALGSIPFFTTRFYTSQLTSSRNDLNATNNSATADQWNVAKIALSTVGAICALIGLVLFFVDSDTNPLVPYRMFLWAIGVLMFTLGMIWRTHDQYRLSATAEWLSESGISATESADDADQIDAEAAGPSQSVSPATAKRESLLDPYDGLISKGLIGTLLLAIVAIGALLRYWAMQALPQDCVGTECVLLFNVMNEQGTPLLLGEARSFYEVLASVAYNFIEPGIAPLRMISVFVGTATLLAFYGFASKLVRSLGALAATALLAVHPWHVGASASAEAAITIPLLLSLGMWFLLHASEQNISLQRNGWLSQKVRPWSATLAGIFLAATAVEIMALSDANLLWLLGLNLLFLAVILFTAARHWFTILWLLIGGALALLPLLGTQLLQLNSAQGNPSLNTATAAITTEALQPSMTELLRTLFWRGSIGSIGSLGESSLLGVVVAALALLGIGSICRSVLGNWRTPTRWPGAIFVFFELLTLSIVTVLILHHAQTGGSAQELSSLLLLLVPLIFVAAAAALDQLSTGFAYLWQRLIHPETVSIAVVLGALLLSAPSAYNLITRLDNVNQSGNAQVDSAIGRYLAEQLQIDSGQSRAAGANVIGTRTYFLPPQSMENPAVRMLGGPQFETAVLSGQVRGFDLSRDLLFVNAEGDELVYLVPANDQNLMMMLEQVHPRGIPELQLDERTNELLFTAYRVSQQILRESRGVRGFYFAGMQLGPNSEAQHVSEGEAVDFDWTRQSPVIAAPFSARWEGTILIPIAGEYTFSLEGDGIGSTETATVWLDNMRILDSAAGRLEGRQTLARGTYRLDIHYQTPSDSTGFRLLWQQPSGVTGVVPQDLLQSNTIPSIGLLGTYFENDNFAGPGDLLRKDFVLGADVPLSSPYSVRWNGKLAAPRSGEYVIGVITAGDLTLDVDRNTLVNTRLPELEDTAATETESTFNLATKALVYLERGWHDIQINYVPAGNGRTEDGEPDIQLYWGQPGSEFAPLSNQYLAPVLASVGPTDMPLPPPAPLVMPAPNLDESRFAFTVIDDSYTKFSFQNIVPPSTLPPLNSKLVWQTQDGCGTLPTQFAEPRGVTIEPESGRIFVADTGNQRIVQYAIDSNEAVRIYTSTLFEEPFDIDISQASGRSLPLVLDSISQRIFQIDPDADPQDAVTVLPQDASFYRPRGFAVDVSGNIIVADTGGGRAVVMNPEGRVLVEYGGQGTTIARGQPVDVVAGARNIWLITAEDGRLWNLRSFELENGSLTAVLPTSTLRGPRFAEVPGGGFLVSDPLRRQILLHGADGQPLRQFSFGDFFRKPIGIDMNVVDGKSYMTVIDMDSCVLSLWQLDSNELIQ